MLFLFIAYTVICMILYFMVMAIETPGRKTFCRDLVYCVIFITMLTSAALYQDYSEVVCKGHGGVLVRGAVLYTCVPGKHAGVRK